MAFKTFKLSMNFLFFLPFIYFSFVSFVKSTPIDSSYSYENFIKDIKHDNCSFPAGVILPLKSAETFDYLSKPLGICRASKESKLSQETRTICNEVFNSLKNITCHPDKNHNLPEIRVEFADDVCLNISLLISDPSLTNSSLLKHLTDKFICNIMCADNFLEACKVLLWSHQIQKLIEYVPRVQNEEIKKDEAKTPEITDEGNHPEKTIADTSSREKTTLAEKIGDLSKMNDSYNKIKTNEEQARKDQNLMTSPVLSEGENNKSGDEENSVPESTVGHPDQPIKTNNHPLLIEKYEETNAEDLKLNEKKTEDENKAADIAPTAAKVSEILTKSKDNTNLKTDENKASTKSIVETSKINSSTSKIADTPELQKNHEKNVNVVEKVKNATKVDKIEESHQLQNEAEEKDDTQPAVVPEISNEAEDDKVMKQKTDKAKEGLNNEVLSTIGNNEETTLANSELEKMEEGNEIPEPVDKDQDPYNDMENDGEYSKLDYDEDGFYVSSKNKKTDEVENRIPKPVDVQNELPKYDSFPVRNSVGRGSDDIQVIPAFPEQEDSHFFFYFLSLVLLLMGGYLLFHNKQKIIALIVEGRHERRRRSHGIGYKKLETK